MEGQSEDCPDRSHPILVLTWDFVTVCERLLEGRHLWGHIRLSRSRKTPGSVINRALKGIAVVTGPLASDDHGTGGGQPGRCAHEPEALAAAFVRGT